MEGTKRIMVKIFDEDYVVKGNEDEQYVQMLANYVDRHMKMLNQRNPNLSAARLSVLTALNLADELNRLQDDYDELVQALEEEKKHRQG